MLLAVRLGVRAAAPTRSSCSSTICSGSTPRASGCSRALLADDSLEALFFCGAYRDNEVVARAPVRPRPSRSSSTPGSSCATSSSPRSRARTSSRCSRTALKRGDCGPLADAVLKKTGGNPFFVKEFVRSLYDHGVLAYATGSGWRWDLAAIDALGVHGQRRRPHGARPSRACPPATVKALQARRGDRQPVRPRPARRGERVLAGRTRTPASIPP